MGLSFSCVPFAAAAAAPLPLPPLYSGCYQTSSLLLPFLLAASCCHVAACCCRNVLWRVVNLKRLQISAQAHIKYTHTGSFSSIIFGPRISLGKAKHTHTLRHTHAESCTCMIDKYIDRDSSTRFYIQTEGMWRVWQLHN